MLARRNAGDTHRPLCGSRIFVIGLDDPLDEAVTHNVALVEMDHGDAFDVAYDFHRLDKPRATLIGQIDLRNIARDYRLRIEPEASEKHFHLLARGVLRFVENHE